MPDNNNNIEEVQNARHEMQDLMRTVANNMANISDEDRARANELISQGSAYLDRVDNFQVGNLSGFDMIGGAYEIANAMSNDSSAEEVAGVVLENTLGPMVDNFLEEYAQYEGELFNFDYTQSFPVFTGVNVDVGFGASVEAKLEVARDENNPLQVNGTAELSATARLSVGGSLGFNVPGIGNQTVGIGLQGGPDISAGASCSLELSGTNMVGNIGSATFNVSLGAELYFSVPDAIPDDVTEWVAEALSLTSSGNRILYSLGTIELLTASSPTYSVTFSITSGRFSNANASGEWSYTLHPVLENAIESVKNAFASAIADLPERALEAAGEFIDGAVDATVEFAEDAYEATEEFVEDTANYAEELYNNARDYVSEQYNQASEYVSEQVEQATEYVSEQYDAAVEYAQETYESVQETISEYSEQAQEAYENVTETVSEYYDTARDFASDVADTASDALDSVGDAASDAYDAVAESEYNPLNWF